MKNLILTAALALSLTACAATARPVVGSLTSSQTTITLNDTWSDISEFTQGVTPGSKVLTLDGPALNRLYVSDIKVGQPMVRSSSKEKPTPVLRADLSFNEQVEFVADSVAALGYFRVETRDLRPQKFGSLDGLRFEVDAQTQEGLNIDGAVLAAMSKDGVLHLVMFLAPEEHYFSASSQSVEKILASAQVR